MTCVKALRMPLRVQARRRHRFSEWTLSEVLELQGARMESLRSPSAKLGRSARSSRLAQRTTLPPREAKSQEGRCHDKTYGLRFAVQPKGNRQFRSRMVIDSANSRVSAHSTAAECVHVRAQWLQLALPIRHLLALDRTPVPQRLWGDEFPRPYPCEGDFQIARSQVRAWGLFRAN